MDGNWVIGDRTGLSMPADPAALRDGGVTFLTEAFQAFGVLDPSNSVTRIERHREIAGGSTGRKALLDIRYAKPQAGLHTELFVKYSRDFDDPVRDRGRTQMAAEVAFAALAGIPGFPIAVPATQFADYHRDSGSGMLVSERISYGAHGIEPQYHKCLDYEMPRPEAHYRAIITALGRLAGTHRSGRLPAHLVAEFPVDLQSATVGEPPEITPERLSRQLDRLAEFTEEMPKLLPEEVRAPAFITRLRQEAPQLAARAPAIWRHLEGPDDHIALCHWNANVDNAWFWTDDGELRCGLMDWGCVSQMNVAMAIWGALCAAETQLWADHFDGLLDLFCAEFQAAGGPSLDRAALSRQVLLYTTLMGITWLLDVPARIRAKVPDAGPAMDRYDPRVKDHESVRAPLQMLTNVLGLWQSRDLGQALATLPG